MKAKIRALTHRTSQQGLASILTRLGQIMRGWANYFKHAVAKWTFSKLDTFTWWRLAHLLRARHRWNWGQLRHHLTKATGRWVIEENGIESLGLEVTGRREARRARADDGDCAHGVIIAVSNLGGMEASG